MTRRTKRDATSSTCNCRAGATIEGFRILQVVPLPDLQATAIRAEHIRSGAQVLHVFTPSDAENGFAAAFPTPPPDDTGLPHILEHAALGGSHKFPIREPFFEMVKMSMATFINAMTAPGYTVYPFASNVKRDYFNLGEVYLDAVFHPVLAEDTFRREGHHLTLADNANLSSPLTVSGIVFSEMKGAYSAPESLLGRLSDSGLYPDTPFGRDSGGDPAHIPELTYEQFLRFHREHYHPSKALIFLYGDIPTEEQFRFLAPVLDAFDPLPGAARTPPALPPRQPRWTTPRRIESAYPIGAAEAAAGRAFFTLNWIVGDALDAAQACDWEVLAHLLIGHDAAPLKKALVDSKLGADVIHAGTWASAHEQEFHVGLKGSEPERAEAFEACVLDALRQIAAAPFPRERVEAAYRRLAYDALEVKTLFPLHLLSDVNRTWPHGGDPLAFLRMRTLLAESRKRCEDDPQHLTRLLREALLDNPHRLRVTLRPDCQAQARADAAWEARMAGRRAQFSDAQIAELARSAAALQASQGVPNSPEALAHLPQLKVGDLPAQPRRIPTTVGAVAGFTVLRNEVFANGVNHLEADVDLAGLPLEAYAWLALFTEAVNKMGAAGQPFDLIAERRAACTGGLWAFRTLRRHAVDAGQSQRRLRFGLKTLDDQAADAWQLLGDLLFGIDPHDRSRLRDVLTQMLTGLRTSLVNDGLGTAICRAARGLSPEAAIEHRYASPDALRIIETLSGDFDARAGEIVRQIEAIRDFLLARARWTFSFTGGDGAFRTFTDTLETWSSRMRPGGILDVPLPFQTAAGSVREGLAAPLAIAHCAQVMPAPTLAHPDTPLLRLGLYLARFDYLLPEIRFKGNAYGASVGHDDGWGTLTLQSFRDPRIVETLQIFQGLRGWIASQRWTQTDIDRAIIGSAKDMERPIRPGAATSAALTRHLRGETHEHRERFYAAALRATPETVREATLRVLDAGQPRTAVCVVSSREKLEEANRRMGDAALSVADILR